MTPRARKRGITVPVVDVIVESRRWVSETGAATMVRRAIRQAADDAALACPAAAELTVVLTDDATIRTLNHRWRGIEAPTNVLSFPAGQTSRQVSGDRAGRPLGDIVIAYETTAREADAEGKLLEHHLAHLTVHGFLHLLGYDHESDEAADAMEQLERTILARLNVPDPYVTRDAGRDIDRHV
jgi:probable rRNA maturation factor